MHALRAGLDELLCFAWLARSVETRMLSEVFGLSVGLSYLPVVSHVRTSVRDVW